MLHEKTTTATYERKFKVKNSLIKATTTTTMRIDINIYNMATNNNGLVLFERKKRRSS